MFSRLDRIKDRAEHYPQEVFNNLFSLLTPELLRLAFGRLKRGKTPGVDGVTVEDYAVDLENNLQSLHQRLHRGSYRPQPSQRRDIPKGNGKTRPLGIAAVEDKLVQRAVVIILERIYEVDFCDTSYGFRPKRSCHMALAELGKIIATKKVNWISDADIKGFFDNVCHATLSELLRQRIGDLRMLRLIERFLQAGVMIEGRREETDDGVPQGSVLSPLFLGFTHYCGQSRANRFKLKRRTAKKKLKAKLQDMKDWLRSRLIVPLREVWPLVNAKLTGHFQHYNVNGNWPSLEKYRRLVSRLCLRWLRRRSQKGKTLCWSELLPTAFHSPFGNARTDHGFDRNG